MAWIFFGTLPCRKKETLMKARVSILLKSRASLTCFRTCFLPGRAKDLSAPLYIYIYIHIHGVTGGKDQTSGGCSLFKLYRKTPKHLYPKLNGFGDNGQWSFKLWQLLHTYWLQNSHWNWQEYAFSVMLISVLFIKVTCEWHRAINFNCKVPRIRVILILTVRSTIHHTGTLNGDVTRLPAANLWVDKKRSWQLSFLDPKEVHNFQFPLSPKPFNFGYRCFGVFRYSLT